MSRKFEPKRSDDRSKTEGTGGSDIVFKGIGALAVATGVAAASPVAVGIGAAVYLYGRALRGDKARRRKHLDNEAQTLFEAAIEAVLTGKPAPSFSLFLRPFALTGSMKFTNGDWDIQRRNPFGHSGVLDQYIDLERVLTQAMGGKTPLIGLGQPGEHYGAGRIKVEDADWQHAARVLMEAADHILLLPYPAEGTLWEVESVFAPELICKTVWVMPPSPVTKKEQFNSGWEALNLDIEAYWNACVGELENRKNIKLLPYDAKGCFFRVHDAGAMRAKRIDFPLARKPWVIHDRAYVARKLEEILGTPAPKTFTTAAVQSARHLASKTA